MATVLEMSLLALAMCATSQDSPQPLYRLSLGPANMRGGRAIATPSDGKIPHKVRLSIPAFEGTYAIPYIQSSMELNLMVDLADSRVAGMSMQLMRDGKTFGKGYSTASKRECKMPSIAPGEYVLRVEAKDAHGKAAATDTYGPIGVGAVIAAIGDSITEGYYGHGFFAGKRDRTAADFPAESVSRDGRNFPQFSPTTNTHLPSVDSFESWMTRLNNRLTEAWKHPVFIANEGWGGIATGGYLDMMTKSPNWRERVQFLKPNVWLIHLGVNDERAQAPRDEFARNMEMIVRTLEKDYDAVTDRIFIAKPCFDYFEGAEPILKGYCEEIDKLVARLKLGVGADFFAGYAKDKARWYGDDPVHPNVEGMDRMADLWRDALVRALPNGIRP